MGESHLLSKNNIGLFQKKFTPPQQIGFLKFSWEGRQGPKAMEIQANGEGNFETQKIFFWDHFQPNIPNFFQCVSCDT